MNNKLISAACLLFLLCPISSFSQETRHDSTTGEVSLSAVLKTAIFGIPDGLEEPGREAYWDFDTDTLSYRDFGEEPPPGWDLLFTYVVKDVSMGPMGTHPVPYFTVKANILEGALFYLTDEGYDSIERADFSLLSHEEYQFKAGKKLRYRAEEEKRFVLKTTGNKAVKLLFTDIEGRDEDNRLFSAVFFYSEIPGGE